MSGQEPTLDAAAGTAEDVAWTTLEARRGQSAEASLPVVTRAPAPRRIGFFELGEVLGRGAFGTVYRARDVETHGREVAIKIFDARITTEEARVRFRREVEIASRLDHPLISSIIDYGTHDDSPYLVMRLIRGGTLKDKLERDGPFPPGEAARIMQRLALAIQHAHSRNAVHRDLKPSNILLEEGDPIVVDLGLSKSLIATDSFTGKGDLVGSPLFMSPEQLAGDRADERADVFGLGGLLYYLLTGEEPRTLEDFRQRVTREARLPRTVPSGLAAICGKALARRRERRFRSAQEMADSIDDWLAGRQLAFDTGSPLRRFLPAVMLRLIVGAIALTQLQRQQSQRALILEANLDNRYSIGDTELRIKDGRTQLGPQSELLFPYLKVIVGRQETWSPPRQQIETGREYIVGRDLAGFISLRFSFLRSPSPIRGRVVIESHRPGLAKEQAIELKAQAKMIRGQTLVDGTTIDFAGRLEGRDQAGLTWGHQREDQLLVNFGGRPTWSPPRPANRMNYWVEYPLGLADNHIVTATAVPSTETSGYSITIRVYDQEPSKGP